MYQGASYGKALLHSTGERPHAVVLPVAHADLFQQVVYSRIEVARSIHPPEEPEVLGCREFMVKVCLVRDDAYLFSDRDRVLFDVNTIDNDLPISRAYKSGKYFDQRCLSCTVGSEYRKELTLLYLKVDATEDDVGSK